MSNIRPSLPHHPALPADDILARCNFDYVFAWEGGKAGNRYNRDNDYFSNIAGVDRAAGYPPAAANFAAPPGTAFERVTLSGRDEFVPDTLFNMADTFLQQQAAANASFFLYYPMLLVHDPVSSPPGYPSNAPLQQRYEFQVQYADRLVGRMRTRLQELGLADDTLLLVVGDNGEHRDITTRWGPNALAVRGDKYGVGDEGTRVPFIAEWPRAIRPGLKSQRLLDVSDFLPTLMDAVGGALPAKAGRDPIQGQSFFDDLLREDDGGREGREWIFTEYDRRRAFRSRASRIEHVKGANAIYATQPWYQAQKLATPAVCASSELLMLANAASTMLQSHPGVIQLPNGPALQKCRHGVVCGANGMPRCAKGEGHCEVLQCDTCQTGTSHRCAVCADGHALETVDGYRCVPVDAPTVPGGTFTPRPDSTLTPTASTAATSSAHSVSTSNTAGTTTAGGVSTTAGDADTTATTTTAAPTTAAPTTTATTATIAETTTTTADDGSPGPCASLVPGCTRCRTSNPFRCDACKPGLAPNRKGKQCNPDLPCTVSHCAECSPNGRKCITCKAGYALSNSRKRCRQSQGGGEDVPTTAAAPTSTTAAAAPTSTTAAAAPTSTTAAAAPTSSPLPCASVKGCIECRKGNPSRCKTCANGLAPNRKGKQCNPKLPCDIDNCATCSPNGRKCITCAAGYALANKRKRCVNLE